jgi:hypothetical protein
MSVKHFSVIKIVAGLEFRGSIPQSPTNIGKYRWNLIHSIHVVVR